MPGYDRDVSRLRKKSIWHFEETLPLHTANLPENFPKKSQKLHYFV